MPAREPVDMHDRRVANAMGWGAGLVVAVSFALMALTYFRPLWVLNQPPACNRRDTTIE